VLEHITLTAEPGCTTAFIGSTGSGKSTLVNLIPRFYDVTEGSITIDGIDIRNVTQHDLREIIGYIPQKAVLFSGDIGSNIRYGKEDATDEEVRLAAKIAQAEDFIESDEEHYDKPIAQGGSNVSGGQKQRLSIARALAKNAPIYIFDDSFSALDFKTDAALRKALKTYTSDATVLIVAQRVSTIMDADKIIVLDDGDIVGIGTHRQLLKDCDVYREIAESQLSKEELA
jgi:ATP-binding cassette subfamily B protein